MNAINADRSWLAGVASQAADDHVCDRHFQLDGEGKVYPICRTCGTIDYDGTHRSAAVVDAILAVLFPEAARRREAPDS